MMKIDDHNPLAYNSYLGDYGPPRVATWKKALLIVIWVLVLGFLITDVVLLSEKANHENLIVTRSQLSSQLRFPAVMVCPTYVSPGFRHTSTLASAVSVRTPALFDAIYSPVDLSNGYAVCPRNIVFVNPAKPDDNHTCVDFGFAPELRLDQTNASSCLPGVAHSYYFPVTAPEQNLNGEFPPPDKAWMAFRTSSNIAFSFSSENTDNNLPLQMLLYSDNSLQQPPRSFSDYEEIFGLGGYTSLKFPLSSFSIMQISKQRRQNPESKADRFGGVMSGSDCDKDHFISSSTNYPSSSGMQSVMMSYLTLTTDYQCVQPALTTIEVLGLFGGAVAILALLTYIVRWIAMKCSEKKRSDYNHLDYPLQDTGF